MKEIIKKIIERIIYESRWLLFPVYSGLCFGFFLLTLKFFHEITKIIPEIFLIKESNLILTILSLVDISLVGGLLVMVMFSGYENFILKMDTEENKKRLSWMGKMDINSIKNKVSSSIVAISSVHLLRIFMESEETNDNKIMLSIFIHLTFVTSSFIMVYIDKINKEKD